MPSNEDDIEGRSLRARVVSVVTGVYRWLVGAIGESPDGSDRTDGPSSEPGSIPPSDGKETTGPPADTSVAPTVARIPGREPAWAPPVDTLPDPEDTDGGEIPDGVRSIGVVTRRRRPRPAPTILDAHSEGERLKPRIGIDLVTSDVSVTGGIGYRRALVGLSFGVNPDRPPGGLFPGMGGIRWPVRGDPPPHGHGTIGTTSPAPADRDVTQRVGAEVRRSVPRSPRREEPDAVDVGTASDETPDTTGWPVSDPRDRETSEHGQARPSGDESPDLVPPPSSTGSGQAGRIRRIIATAGTPQPRDDPWPRGPRKPRGHPDRQHGRRAGERRGRHPPTGLPSRSSGDPTLRFGPEQPPSVVSPDDFHQAEPARVIEESLDGATFEPDPGRTELGPAWGPDERTRIREGERPRVDRQRDGVRDDRYDSGDLREQTADPSGVDRRPRGRLERRHLRAHAPPWPRKSVMRGRQTDPAADSVGPAEPPVSSPDASWERGQGRDGPTIRFESRPERPIDAGHGGTAPARPPGGPTTESPPARSGDIGARDQDRDRDRDRDRGHDRRSWAEARTESSFPETLAGPTRRRRDHRVSSRPSGAIPAGAHRTGRIDSTTVSPRPDTSPGRSERHPRSPPRPRPDAPTRHRRSVYRRRAVMGEARATVPGVDVPADRSRGRDGRQPPRAEERDPWRTGSSGDPTGTPPDQTRLTRLVQARDYDRGRAMALDPDTRRSADRLGPGKASTAFPGHREEDDRHGPVSTSREDTAGPARSQTRSDLSGTTRTTWPRGVGTGGSLGHPPSPETHRRRREISNQPVELSARASNRSETRQEGKMPPLTLESLDTAPSGVGREGEASRRRRGARSAEPTGIDRAATVGDAAVDDESWGPPGGHIDRDRPSTELISPAPTVDGTAADEDRSWTRDRQSDHTSESRRTHRPAPVEELFVPGGPDMGADAELDRVVDKLYRRIERRLRIERERRGL